MLVLVILFIHINFIKQKSRVPPQLQSTVSYINQIDFVILNSPPTHTNFYHGLISIHLHISIKFRS